MEENGRNAMDIGYPSLRGENIDQMRDAIAAAQCTIQNVTYTAAENSPAAALTITWNCLASRQLDELRILCMTFM